MVFKFLTFIPNDNYLNTRPGSPPAFTPSPSASPIVCSGCTGVISRFNELQLQDLSRDGGAVEEAQEENPGRRNGSAGKANPIAEKQDKEVGLIAKAVGVLDAIGSMTNLNMNSSFRSRSRIKGPEMSILALEVAKTITKGANLMQSLSEQNIVYLKDELLPSEGVQYLVSTDMDELLRIAAADWREELHSFIKEVARFGNLCKEAQFHYLDRHFESKIFPGNYRSCTCFSISSHRGESSAAPGTPLRKDAWGVMLPLMNLVQSTSELYSNLQALDRIEKDYQQKRQEHISLGEKDKNQSLSILRSQLKSQRIHVRSLKKKSLWSRSLEEVVEKLVDIIILCLQMEVLKSFGSADCERAAGGSASNGSKLGSSDLALHYASIITQIDTIVAHSGSVTPTMRNELYQGLPPGTKSAMHLWLRQVQIQEEPTIPIIKATMEKTLSWLAPLAANTIKAHYGFAKLGEWANMRSRVNQRPTGRGDLIRIDTLYHADKEKTEPYIVELLFWLHQLVCKRRAMNNGITCSLDSTVSSLSDEEIRSSSYSLRKDVHKRKLMRRTSETLESETGNPYSCYYHLPGDSPANRSPGVSVPILKTLSMDFGIDMMTALDVIDGIPASWSP